MKWSPFYRSHSQEGGREYTLPEQGDQNNKYTRMSQHAEQLWLAIVKYSYMYAVGYSSAVSRSLSSLKSGIATRTDSPVGFGVVYHGHFLPNFRDRGLMHISRLQPCAKREPGSTACSTENQERVWYLFS